MPILTQGTGDPVHTRRAGLTVYRGVLAGPHAHEILTHLGACDRRHSLTP